MAAGEQEARAASKEKVWPGDLGQPIVIPFRMSGLGEQEAPKLRLDGLPEMLTKLTRLADYYGINKEGSAGWGLLLAFRIAMDLHPGFQFVYDDPRATLFNRRHGTNFPALEGSHPHHRPKGTGWAPELSPEAIALLADTIGKTLKSKSKWTDRQFCELLVCSFEPRLEKASQASEKNKKIATLIRRLTEGRRRAKARASK